MKQLFPVLIAIMATTVVLAIVMSGKRRTWAEMAKHEKILLVAMILSGCVLLAGGLVTLLLLR